MAFRWSRASILGRIQSRQMIYLRKLNDSDLSFLNYVENDHENWKSSNTISKFENKELKLLINQSKLPINLTKQLRLVICKKSDHSRIGFIDLFDYDSINKKAGVGTVSYTHLTLPTKA